MIQHQISHAHCRRGATYRRLRFGAIWLAVAAAGLPAAAQPAEPAVENGDLESPLRETSIYIPYDELREVIEREGRGVFLPYEKFQELWKAARKADDKPPAAGPPVDSLITEIDSEAVVTRDVVLVTAQIKMEVFKQGWIEIPLRLRDAAIRSATIDNAPARLTGDPQNGYQLLFENPDKKPQEIELALEYAKTISKSPGQNSISVEAPLAPVNRWKIRIPESGVKVNIHPLLAATEAPADDEAESDDGAETDDEAETEGEAPTEAETEENGEEPAGETVVLAFVGAAPTVRIDWTPKAEGARGMTALASVETEQEVFIDEGVTRSLARLTYTISRAELRRLELDVPGDQKVAGVFDANVRQWNVEVDGDRARISVDLFQPATATQPIRVELEQFRSQGQAADVVVPVIHARAVGRQQGIVTVQLAAGLRGQTARRVGLTQLDRSDLPASLAKKPLSFAYRYTRTPFELALGVEKVEPEIETDSLAEVYVEPQQLSLELTAIYNVERAGIYELSFDVPADFEVEDVRGHAAKGIEAAAVDSFYREGEKETQLRVNLAKKALGRVGVVVVCRRRLDDPNLLKPTGESTSLNFTLPRVDPADIGRARGQAVVYAPESLRVIPADDPRLRSVSFEEATRRVPSGRNGRYAGLAPVLSFAFSHDKTREPESLVLATTRRKPNIAVRQLLVAGIDTGEIRYTATFHYNIRYSGVESLTIAIPAQLAGKVRNDTPGVRDERVSMIDQEAEGREEEPAEEETEEQADGQKTPTPNPSPEDGGGGDEGAPEDGGGGDEGAPEDGGGGDEGAPEDGGGGDEGAPEDGGGGDEGAAEDGGGGDEGAAEDGGGGDEGGAEDGGGADEGAAEDGGGADGTGSQVLWKFTGETEFLGDVTIKLAWEVPTVGLDVGKPFPFTLPKLEPLGVDRSRGQVVLTKTETIDVVPIGEPVGLNPIDPQTDLFKGTSVKDAARAFEFHDDWSLAVKATQYQLEEIKRTSIDRAVVRAVVTRSDQVAVQSIYRMRSAQQRLEVKLPAKVEPDGITFDTDPLRINGRPVALERGGDSQSFFVPLVGIDPTESFVLELRYTMPGSYRRIDLASFPSDPAVQKIHLCVYIPTELAYLGARGPWSEALEWHRQDVFRWQPEAATSDRQMITELTDGVPNARSSVETFPTDGKLLLFTAVQPEDPPDGSLRITAINGNWLSGLVFGVVAVFGVVLARRGFSARVLGLGLLAVVAVLLGVFLPTFSRQVTGRSLWLALALVIFVWAVVWVSQWRSARATRAEAAASETSDKPVVDQPKTNENGESAAEPGPAKSADSEEGGTSDA